MKNQNFVKLDNDHDRLDRATEIDKKNGELQNGLVCKLNSFFSQFCDRSFYGFP